MRHTQTGKERERGREKGGVEVRESAVLKKLMAVLPQEVSRGSEDHSAGVGILRT